MKLCMFHPVEQLLERGWVGRIDGEHVIQLAAQTLQSFFTGGGIAREHAVYPLDGVRLLAPVLHPPSVRVFEDQESFAFANPAAIVPPGAAIAASMPGRGALALLPRLAAVIGAEGGIGGYAVFADWRRPGVTPPKDRDFALGLGPVVVTPDEVDPSRAEAVIRANGAERLRGSFDGFDWAAACDLAAEGTMLFPGDLVVGPALGAVDATRGEAVEIDVQRIGVLDATVGG
jgi:hypothetical protein